MQTKNHQGLHLQSPRLNHLNILRELAISDHVTQAELAKVCSLSVAMVNNYMKELCRSGLIEYHRKSAKTVTYHLTDSGSSYLGTLQSDLIDEMAGMFAAAKDHVRACITSQFPAVLKRVVLYGSGHLAQIVFHALEVGAVKILGICDDSIEAIGGDFCGRQVLNPSQIRFLAPDAVIVADSERAEDICRILASLSGTGIQIIRLDKFKLPFGMENPKIAPYKEKAGQSGRENLGDLPVPANFS